MAWSIEGRYLETCTCDVVCPCTVSFALPADNDYCRVALIFHVDRGEVEGVDVNGFTVAAVAETGKYMHEGNWRLGILMDEAASDEQAEKLGGVFSGQLGGPMATLAPLVGEQLGVERAPMEFSSDNGHHTLTVGDRGRLDVEEVVPFGVESGEPAKLTDIFSPAATTLNIAKATEASGLSAFGLDLSNAGKAGFAARFAWSA
jgi:hypothetical protein